MDQYQGSAHFNEYQEVTYARIGYRYIRGRRTAFIDSSMTRPVRRVISPRSTPEASAPAPGAPIKRVDPLLQKLSKLLKTGAASDFAIRVNYEEFRVHKFVLAMHSPVIAATFRNDDPENLSKDIEIKNFDSDTVKEFIYYLYNGEIVSDENAVELFLIADLYGVEGLRSLSEKIILRNIDEENALDIFSLGYLHTAEKLTFKAFSHIQKMCPDLQLAKLLKEDPLKMIEVVRSTMKKTNKLN